MPGQISDFRSDYENRKAKLLNELKDQVNVNLYIKKKTASNLFRYIKQTYSSSKGIAIKQFDHILGIDIQNKILDVEGLTPYEKIVKYTLKQGLLPTVAPELKHITIGGAIVGVGIESTGHQYGFVHDGLLEAEVLLPDGRIIFCNSTNEYADLFHALPNSYGTLGYILRAKIKLYQAQPFVHLSVKYFSNSDRFVDGMQDATRDSAIHFIEGLVFSTRESYLATGHFVSSVNQLDDIYRKNIFYKLIQQKKHIYLKTEDYIFRYDPDWFWNIPETHLYNFFRKWAPKFLRNSGFYKKYIDTKKKILTYLGLYSSTSKHEETLIQDWEVPWENGKELLGFALKHIDLDGKPWAIIPIQPLTTATLYPLNPKILYFNLGCYCSSKSHENSRDNFYNTKIMDAKCFSLGGIKMLYSSTILSREQFNSLYNGNEYQQLKIKYDPKKISGNLYDKVACSSI